MIKSIEFKKYNWGRDDDDRVFDTVVKVTVWKKYIILTVEGEDGSRYERVLSEERDNVRWVCDIQENRINWVDSEPSDVREIQDYLQEIGDTRHDINKPKLKLEFPDLDSLEILDKHYSLVLVKEKDAKEDDNENVFMILEKDKGVWKVIELSTSFDSILFLWLKWKFRVIQGRWIIRDI